MLIVFIQLIQLLRKSPIQDSFYPWHQRKLELALLQATSNGNWRIVFLLIKSGAHNFEECIQSSKQSNHICAFLRLCQAAMEDDMQAIHILVESKSGDAINHPYHEELMILHLVLAPLLQNGKFNFAIPVQIALDDGHKSIAGYLLQHSSKHPRTGKIIGYYLISN